MTIAAIATAPGPGGIAIIRISGPDAETILKASFVPKAFPFRGRWREAPDEVGSPKAFPSGEGGPRSGTEEVGSPKAFPFRGRWIAEGETDEVRPPFPPRKMLYGHILDAAGEIIDEAMAVLMRAPATYTREDVAELHCHGGSVSARRTLARVLELGARLAEPGEFTRRAFLNGRIDLSRAEAVMQLIGANSEAAARASVRQLEGGVSGFVKDVSDRLTGLMALIEASDDFPEEVEEDAASEVVLSNLKEIIKNIETACDPRGARILREGASVVLAGRPNVGKSSIMNALLRQERAGQRATADPIEKIGVDRAVDAVRRADVVLMVVDAAEPISDGDREFLKSADDRTVVCLNKTDLSPATTSADIAALTGAKIVEISARTGAGMDELVQEIARRVDIEDSRETQLVAQRHIDLARRAADTLKRAARAIESGLPLDTAAIDLREALETLTQITGKNAAESVIDRIFADFCVGK